MDASSHSLRSQSLADLIDPDADIINDTIIGHNQKRQMQILNKDLQAYIQENNANARKIKDLIDEIRLVERTRENFDIESLKTITKCKIQQRTITNYIGTFFL